MYIKSKPKLVCESHYYTYYLKCIADSIPGDRDIIINKNSMNINNNSNTNNDKPANSIIHIVQDKNKENQNKEETLRKKLLNRQGIIPDMISNKDNKNSNNRSRSLAKNRNKKDGNVTHPEEIVGYWPRRVEFDIEYLNEAEIEIAELDFFDTDTEEERQIKLQVLEIYNMRLDEREKRKK
jgi:transcriptional adapter 2-alpha